MKKYTQAEMSMHTTTTQRIIETTKDCDPKINRFILK